MVVVILPVLGIEIVFKFNPVLFLGHSDVESTQRRCVDVVSLLSWKVIWGSYFSVDGDDIVICYIGVGDRCEVSDLVHIIEEGEIKYIMGIFSGRNFDHLVDEESGYFVEEEVYLLALDS